MAEIIVESSRSRFWNHLSGSCNLAIISASTAAMKELRPRECRQEEHRASALLHNAIIALGYGSIPLWGGYTYQKDSGSPSSEGTTQSSEFDVEAVLADIMATKASESASVTEPSYAIPEITLDQAIALGAEFG